MDSINLDKRDRGNIYKEEATNILSYEATVDEVRDMVDGDVDELLEQLDEAQGKVHSGTEDVVYFIIKITKGD